MFYRFSFSLLSGSLYSVSFSVSFSVIQDIFSGVFYRFSLRMVSMQHFILPSFLFWAINTNNNHQFLAGWTVVRWGVWQPTLSTSSVLSWAPSGSPVGCCLLLHTSCNHGQVKVRQLFPFKVELITWTSSTRIFQGLFSGSIKLVICYLLTYSTLTYYGFQWPCYTVFRK